MLWMLKRFFAIGLRTSNLMNQDIDEGNEAK